MALTVIVPRVYTQQQIAESYAVKGRPKGRTPSSHVDDMVALRKLVLLCDFCRPKWNPRKDHYELYQKIPVAGNCDACGDHVWTGTAFIPEINHDALIYESPIAARRRRGRWSRN